MDNYDFDFCIGYFEKFVKHIVSGSENVKKDALVKKLHQFLDMTTSATTKSGNSKKVPRPQIIENSIEKRIRLDPKRGVELPNELWVKIMNCLPTKNIFNSFGLVCKRFHDLTSETRYLEIKGVNYVSHLKESEKVLILAKTILQLKIDFDAQIGLDVFSKSLDVIAKCKKLKSLIFENLSGGTINFNPHLLQFVTLQLSNSIQHLKIINGHCNSDAITKIGELKHLKSLHMEVDNYSIGRITQINKLEHLEVLRVKNYTGQTITFDDFHNLRCPLLKEFSLELTNGQLMSSHLKKLIDISPNLKLIEITGNIDIPFTPNLGQKDPLMFEILKKHNILQYTNNFEHKRMIIHLMENLENESDVINVNWPEKIKNFKILKKLTNKNF